MNKRIKSLLKKIEWQGSADYLIGIKTCPCCGKMGGVRKESNFYQGHSPECELKNIINSISDDGDEIIYQSKIKLDTDQ